MRVLQLGALCALMGLLGAGCAYYFTSRSVKAAVVAAPASRQYYLTKNAVTGDAAATACAAGYHMASFFEIADVSALQYDTTQGVTTPDSGSGPPTVVPTGIAAHGWVRTGGAGVSDASNNFGSNCTHWTSGSGSDHGSVVYLILGGSSDNRTVAPIWQYELFYSPSNAPPPTRCSVPHRVWCVQN